jgi:ABC-type multidrug transport system fused ATPase/permease subunit
VALFVFRSVAQVAFGYLRGKITANFLNNESKDVLSKIFSASWPYLLKQRLGYIHGTTVQDVQKSAILLEVLGQSIQSFTGFFMYLLIALNISALTTLATLVAGVVLLLIVRPLMRKIQAVGNSMVAVEKDVAQFLAEHVLGLKAIKASAVEHQALTYGQGLFQHMRSLNIRMTFIRSVSTSLFQPFGIFFIIILFSISYHSPGFSLISFAATLYLIQKIFTYLESGQSSVNSVNELLPYAENVETFKHQLQEHAETMTSGNEPFVLTNSIAFSSVSLTYQGTVSALTNATFTINKGDTVGLIGPSGAGKTSIADLVLRLFEPTSGKILVDGTPLHNISMNEWRHNVGYVPQDIFLLNTTIEENIRFYRPELTHEEIVEAAKKANSYNFIMSLENGFETSIGDRGVMLSGGQRQRIVLTRALAGNPEILILDEATSALDNESEAVIQEAIHNLHRSITVLIIAHRLSTVESADKVVVLEKGKVIEQGSPKELDADEASYYHRVKHGL